MSFDDDGRYSDVSDNSSDNNDLPDSQHRSFDSAEDGENTATQVSNAAKNALQEDGENGVKEG